MQTKDEPAECTATTAASVGRKRLPLGISALAYLGLVLVTNWKLITNPLTETGDVAADSLMAMTAWTQTDGHYSRWGYNHPGPLLLWLEHLSELAFPWLPPFGAHLVMSALLVTGSVGALAAALQDSRNISWFSPVVFLLALVGLSDGTVLIPYAPTMGNWFFVMAGAGLIAAVRGRLWGYPLGLFASAALIHLHVLYVPLGVLTFAVLVLCYRLCRRSSAPPHRQRFLVFAMVSIATVMALPLLVDVALGESDWGAYAGTQDQLAKGAYRSAPEAITAFFEVVAPATSRDIVGLSVLAAAVFLLLLVGLLIVTGLPQQWVKIGAGFGLFGCFYLLALTPLDFIDPISFGRTLPLFMITVLLAAAAPRFTPRKALALVLAGVVVLTLMSTRTSRLAAGRSAEGTAEVAVSTYEAFRRHEPGRCAGDQS